MEANLDPRDPQWKHRSSRWRMQRVRRKIARGYYDRTDIRAEIVETLLRALMEEDNGPSPRPK